MNNVSGKIMNRSFLSGCCRAFSISARWENDFVAFRGRTSSAPSGRGYRKSFLLWVRTVARAYTDHTVLVSQSDGSKAAKIKKG
jgi:hypothetical protein